MKFVITIPGCVPPSPNRLMRMHWGTRRRMVAAWAQQLAYGLTATHRNRLRDAQGIRVVSVTCNHLGVWDPDNEWGASYKIILDAGTRVGYWKDDSAANVKLQPPAQSQVLHRKDVLTRVTIEVAEPPACGMKGAA